MRPTRRGLAVGGVAVAGVSMAWLFGPRALNAIVFPAVVALVAAAVQIRRLPRPVVSRSLPPNGPAGAGGRVTLRFDLHDPFPATVVDALPDGVEGETATETVVGTEPVRYEVRYTARGNHPIGPVRIVARDVLGLLEGRFACGGRDHLLVYPTVRDLPASVVERLRAALVESRHPARGEFDSLREYVRGDAPRDIHWKSSAKRDSLVIQQFTATEEIRGVTIAATATERGVDAMAEAAASLGVALVGEGVPVRLVTPSGTVSASAGESVDLLEHLAEVRAGALAAEGPDEADIRIEATGADPTVHLGDHETTFERLCAGVMPS